MTSGGNNFNDFPDNQLTKFCVFIGWSWIFISPLHLYEAPRFVPPIRWTPLTDTTDKETNERKDGGQSVRLLVVDRSSASARRPKVHCDIRPHIRLPLKL